VANEPTDAPSSPYSQTPGELPPWRMRPSRVLNKLRAGEPAISTKINLSDPRSVEILARSGFDCVWMDLEHVPNDLKETESMIYAAKAYDCDPLVRVRRGSYSDLIVPLELDAAGVMVPHVMSAAEAKQIAYQLRFHPLGRRPMDGGNADGGYCMIDTQDYIEQANRERFVILQIEDHEAMDELDGICAVEGIDMILFGPGDFSHSLGKPGGIFDPEVQQAGQRVVEAAKKAGKFVGTVGPVSKLSELLDKGYDFVNVAADVAGLALYARDTFDQARQQLQQRR